MSKCDIPSWEKFTQDGGGIRHFRRFGKLIATVVFVESDGMVDYGVAYVSELDNPSLEKGRQLAYRRLLKAQESKNGYYISPPLKKILKNIKIKKGDSFLDSKYGFSSIDLFFSNIEMVRNYINMDCDLFLYGESREIIKKVKHLPKSAQSKVLRYLVTIFETPIEDEDDSPFDVI